MNASRGVIPAVVATLFFYSYAAAQSIVFQDVSTNSGLSYQLSPCSGACERISPGIGDYDGDGWLDVCLTGSTVSGTRLFRNQQDGTFADVTTVALPTDTPNASIAMFADMNNDGAPEMLLARRYGGTTDVGFGYLLNEAGVFTNGLVEIDAGRHPTQIGGMAVSDFELDGDLDVVLVHQEGPGYWLRNDGAAGITDQSALYGATLGTSRRYWSVIMADFDGNGLVDLHAAIDVEHDFHCRQGFVGSFTEVSEAVGVSNGGSDMGLAIGDIENDGDLDIFSTNINRHVLYVNNGSGVFADEAASRGVQTNGNPIGFSWGWGTTFADFDHDQDEDLIYIALLNPGALFQNNGNGHFTNITSNGGVYAWGFGLAPFDYDRDGDLDVLITSSDTPPKLYENVSPALAGNHFLSIKLSGRTSNREGVGARLLVSADGVTMTRVVLGGYSFISGPPIHAHFGLGASTVADSLTVIWPSGIRQTRENVAADQFLTVVEGDLNADRSVDLSDFAALQVCYAGSGNPISPQCATGMDADLDDDGDVDLGDFEMFAATLPVD